MRKLTMAIAGWSVLLTGCGPSWSREPMNSTGSLAPRQQVEVWVHGSGPQRVIDVRWSKDSLYAKPYLAALDPGMARPLVVARSEVDSIRTGKSSAGTWKVAGILFAGVAVITLAACASTPCGIGE